MAGTIDHPMDIRRDKAGVALRGVSRIVNRLVTLFFRMVSD
jgi:hypothetical protein